MSAFFEAYYGGMEALRTEEDFYELAMGYFEKAKRMGVRYAEVMVDLQAHTRRGVGTAVVMEGLRRSREDAGRNFNVCIARIIMINKETEKCLMTNRSQAISLYAF